MTPLLPVDAAPLAEVLHITTERYHAIEDALSNSDVSSFLDDPAWYYGLKAGVYERPASTKSQRLGTLLHAAVLEGKLPLACPECPKEAADVPPEWVQLLPDMYLTDGKKLGNKWQNFKKSQPEHFVFLKSKDWDAFLEYRDAVNSGKPFGTEEEVSAVAHMRASLLKHPKFRELFDEQGGQNEMPVLWNDLDHGLRRRSCLDLWRPKSWVIGDIKTTVDVRPKAIQGTIANYRYDRQAAFYSDAIEALSGGTNGDPNFVFFFVRNTPPWTCEAVPMTENWTMPARQHLSGVLKDIAERWRTNNWATPTADSYLLLDRPYYLNQESEWAV